MLRDDVRLGRRGAGDRFRTRRIGPSLPAFYSPGVDDTLHFYDCRRARLRIDQRGGAMSEKGEAELHLITGMS